MKPGAEAGLASIAICGTVRIERAAACTTRMRTLRIALCASLKVLSVSASARPTGYQKRDGCGRGASRSPRPAAGDVGLSAAEREISSADRAFGINFWAKPKETLTVSSPLFNKHKKQGSLRGRSPRLIFHVVGQSRDDVPTAVQAGGHHPGSQ
jgi:hypothetical protein